MKPSLISLRHIEAFRAVMLSGSVVGAARLLSMTQPGVSRTIGLLELRLGYELFERKGRRLVPTHEAEALYREIEQVYAGISRISQIAQDIRLLRAGTLRIGTLPALSESLVPLSVARFLVSRPNVNVFLQSLPSRQIAELVSTQQFDIGVVELPVSHPAIEVEPIDPSPTVAVIPKKHRLATRKSVSLKDLDGERMVLLSQHSYLRYQVDDAFLSAGVVPHVVAETPSSCVACAMAAAGVGIALVSKWAAEPFKKSSLLVRPLNSSLVSRYAFIFPSSKRRMLLADAFASELRACIKEA